MAPSVRGRQVNLGRMMMMMERMWGDDSLSFSLVRKLKRRGKALLCLRRSVSSQRIPSTQVPVSVLEVCARFYKCMRLEMPKGGSADWKADNNRVKEREGEIVKHSAAFPVSGRAREREREICVTCVCVCVCVTAFPQCAAERQVCALTLTPSGWCALELRAGPSGRRLSLELPEMLWRPGSLRYTCWIAYLRIPLYLRSLHTLARSCKPWMLWPTSRTDWRTPWSTPSVTRRRRCGLGWKECKCFLFLTLSSALDLIPAQQSGVVVFTVRRDAGSGWILTLGAASVWM